MTPSSQPPDIADLVDELCDPITHREHYQVLVHHHDGHTWIGQDHVTIWPPLVTQLWNATHQAAQTDKGQRPGYASKPTARIEALDAAIQIDHAVNQWLFDLTRKQAPLDTITAIRRLHSLTPTAHPVIVKAVERDIRRWWSWARVLTGWDTPAWRPANTCPLCGTRGSLRVKLEAKTAMCVNCRETWDQATIGLLADHIRTENHDQADTPTRTG